MGSRPEFIWSFGLWWKQITKNMRRLSVKTKLADNRLWPEPVSEQDPQHVISIDGPRPGLFNYI